MTYHLATALLFTGCRFHEWALLTTDRLVREPSGAIMAVILADEALEHTISDSPAMRTFAGIDLSCLDLICLKTTFLIKYRNTRQTRKDVDASG